MMQHLASCQKARDRALRLAKSMPPCAAGDGTPGRQFEKRTKSGQLVRTNNCITAQSDSVELSIDFTRLFTGALTATIGIRNHHTS